MNDFTKIKKPKHKTDPLLIWLLMGTFLVCVLLVQLATRSGLGSATSMCSRKVCMQNILDGAPDANDSIATSYIYRNYFTPPSGKPFRLSGINDRFPSQGYKEMKKYINDYFQDIKKGTFVVLGAGDGEYRDLTLDLERHSQWKGLLVEPNPHLVEKMKSKARNAEIGQVCVSASNHPYLTKMAYPKVSEDGTEEEKLMVYREGMNSLFHSFERLKDNSLTRFMAQCLPLQSIIAASKVVGNDIDLLVMDMSGKDDEMMRQMSVHTFPSTKAIVVTLKSGQKSDFIQSTLIDFNFIPRQMFMSKGNNTETRAFFQFVRQRKTDP